MYSYCYVYVLLLFVCSILYILLSSVKATNLCNSQLQQNHLSVSKATAGITRVCCPTDLHET